MNITEALTLAKEKGKKVRPINEEWYVFYKKDDYTLGYFSKGEEFRSDRDFDLAYIKDILSDWEVVEEKTSKQTQYKIDSMKFQIVRHCANQEHCRKCILNLKCIANRQDSMCDDWSLKEIVEAYHILKEAGEI